MATQTINPYPSLGKYLTDGLDDLIKNISGTPTFDEFNGFIESYISKTFDFEKNKLTEIDLISIIPLSVNGYTNGKIETSSVEQSLFIDTLLNTIIKSQPLEIPNLISDFEENISKSNLKTNEQIPLFFATQIGTTMFNYWLKQINDGEASPWYRFLNTNYAVNIANLPYWILASIQAPLILSYLGEYSTNLKEGIKIAGPFFITALTACIGLAAGKLIFKWLPKINVPQLTLDKQPIDNKIAFNWIEKNNYPPDSFNINGPQNIKGQNTCFPAIICIWCFLSPRPTPICKEHVVYA